MKQPMVSRVILLAMVMLPSWCLAFGWQDLWSRPDQQGAQLLHAGKPKAASQRFVSLPWRGVAYYRAGDYEKAAKIFSQQQTALGHYNQGNALAHLGQYREAINAYEAALAKNPALADAAYNRELLEKLLKKHKKASKSGKNHHSQDKKQKQQTKHSPQTQKNAKKPAQKQQQKSAAKRQTSKATAKSTPLPKQQENQQAFQQWLRRIPDDPGGLLARKFQRDHERLQAEGKLY